MFSTYCVFTSIIFYFLFNEKLRPRYIVGISLMLACVILVAISKSSPASSPVEENKITHSPTSNSLNPEVDHT